MMKFSSISDTCYQGFLYNCEAILVKLLLVIRVMLSITAGRQN